MQVLATGVYFVGECDIEANGCTAKAPAPITAVKTAIGGTQINVCRNCFTFMIRDGQWEVAGSQISPKADLSVFSSRGRRVLDVEVKTTPIGLYRDLKTRAIQVRRNLLTHAGIPNADYFMVVYFPTAAYIWRDDAGRVVDALPDFEADITSDLSPYIENESYNSASYGEIAESVIYAWLHDVVAGSQSISRISRSWNNAWLDSGLSEAASNGRLERESSPLVARTA